MIRRLRRASTFAAVAALAALAPTLGDAAVVPFLAVAGLAFFGIRDGEWFETLALPGDREEERLYGFVAFSIAAAGRHVVPPAYRWIAPVCLAAPWLLAVAVNTALILGTL